MKTNVFFTILLSSCMLISCRHPVEDKTSNPNTCIYSCPMHPDKTSAKPTTCPICHMEMQTTKQTLNDSLQKDTLKEK